jgi:hypothetical protein
MSWLEQPRLCSVWEHRTVRWYTGQCPVRQAGSREQAALGISTAVYGYNSSDCPVVHRTVRWAVHRRTRRSRETINGVWLKFTGLSGGAPDCPVSQRSAGPRSTAQSARDTWPSQRLEGCTELSGAPTALRLPTVDCAIFGRKSGIGQCPVCTGLSGAPVDRRQDQPS